MNLNKTTALALRVGILTGMVIIAIGLAVDMMGFGEDVIYWGILILIASPFIGVLASFASLISEKDWRWAGVALVLIIITTTGVFLSV